MTPTNLSNATDLCLPVLKYSYATGVRPDNTIPWTHLQASSLFAVVRGVETRSADGRLHPDGQLSLTLVQGTKVLESIDVAQYVDAAREARHGAEKAGVVPSTEQLPIFGITKHSLLAIRYKLQNGQARRIQMRMQSSGECEQLVAVFVRRGMEFQEQRPRTGQSCSTRISTMSGHDRILHEHPAAISRPFMRQPMHDVGNLWQGPELHQAVESTSWADNANLPEGARRPESMRRPTESMAPPNRVAHVDDSSRRPLPPAEFTRPSETVRHTDVRTGLPGTETPEWLRMPALGATRPWSSSATDAAHGPLTSDPAARPSTAATSTLPDAVETVPPRRELPFKRPGSRYNGSEHESRPGSSALALPPLPRPRLVKEGTHVPVRPNGTGTEPMHERGASEGITVEEYAGQATNDRQAALETFMLDQLEKPEFATLCEDVEQCWRRIALGI
ncbi:hypothetical protein K470DRAFT_272240 [Piedraia hortae CBS 480.64]|uniref:Uncharacterized protein n=1 Tax=Piedraia hortae CBS 480.64 TaxID=1314780 RepID=A0A6A7BVA6_9PEZI|nr:hypothetical protein K470DRAFT_272240 [Piedraia hortae CBS 480.64]